MKKIFIVFMVILLLGLCIVPAFASYESVEDYRVSDLDFSGSSLLLAASSTSNYSYSGHYPYTGFLYDDTSNDPSYFYVMCQQDAYVKLNGYSFSWGDGILAFDSGSELVISSSNNNIYGIFDIYIDGVLSYDNYNAYESSLTLSPVSGSFILITIANFNASIKSFLNFTNYTTYIRWASGNRLTRVSLNNFDFYNENSYFYLNIDCFVNGSFYQAGDYIYFSSADEFIITPLKAAGSPILAFYSHAFTEIGSFIGNIIPDYRIPLIVFSGCIAMCFVVFVVVFAFKRFSH